MSHILIDHLTQAASFYRGQLRASTRAVAYLKARGLRGDIAARYGLGYAPAGFQALREAFPNYNDRALEKAGLVAVNDGRASVAVGVTEGVAHNAVDLVKLAVAALGLVVSVIALVIAASSICAAPTAAFPIFA